MRGNLNYKSGLFDAIIKSDRSSVMSYIWQFDVRLIADSKIIRHKLTYTQSANGFPVCSAA
ncbi:MAG: hypothetical protein ACR2LR_05045 [Hassallia sp.]